MIPTFEEWLKVNLENLKIIFAETGADREMDFNFEREAKRYYEQYRRQKQND